MEGDLKLVEYQLYCHKCENKDKDEIEDPCFDCLNTPANTDSHKPVYFKGE